MNHAWRPIAQRLVRALLIIEPQPGPDTLTSFGHRTIRLDIHLLTTVRSITEQIQLVIIHNETRIVGHLQDHRLYRGFFECCHRNHLHQSVE
jgi:hypothetical protein